MVDDIDYDKCGTTLVYPTDNQNVKIGQKWEQECPEEDNGCKCRSAKVINILGKYCS